ncbi:DUF805 domain-containing protein [Aurantimonas marianensis]|uniref:DUF805 domain-containing protein n=1 Tax=Aurantimonas marianensis TaxID=2920428 RepID=A0A9X2KGA8_9HYPH|nr:DUF805 domain-containing protein [Aurantimonas marianensis]MCP3056080.1 DUF805 domain-containing protein [Aurantimonas marianensis]
MNFTQSVHSVFSHYATFRGRAPRSEFWWFVLFTLIANLALSIVDSLIVAPILGFSPFSDNGARPLSALFSLAIFVPSLAVGARRLHDTGRSAWWLLVGLIPLIGWLIFVYFAVQPSEQVTNEYGPPPVERPPSSR